MTLHPTLLIAALLPLLAACAGTPADPSDSAQYCGREVKTGTNIASTVCRKPEDMARDKRNVEELGDMIRSTPTPNGR